MAGIKVSDTKIVNIVVYDGKKKDDHGRCKSKM